MPLRFRPEIVAAASVLLLPVVACGSPTPAPFEFRCPDAVPQEQGLIVLADSHLCVRIDDQNPAVTMKSVDKERLAELMDTAVNNTNVYHVILASGSNGEGKPNQVKIERDPKYPQSPQIVRITLNIPTNARPKYVGASLEAALIAASLSADGWSIEEIANIFDAEMDLRLRDDYTPIFEFEVATEQLSFRTKRRLRPLETAGTRFIPSDPRGPNYGVSL